MLGGNAMTDSRPSILHLNLVREHFEEIVFGYKRREYRSRTPHWATRLEGQTYDIVRFKNGYGSDVPEMDVEFKGVEKTRSQYVIRLGRRLTLKNWPQK